MVICTTGYEEPWLDEISVSFGSTTPVTFVWYVRPCDFLARKHTATLLYCVVIDRRSLFYILIRILVLHPRLPDTQTFPNRVLVVLDRQNPPLASLDFSCLPTASCSVTPSVCTSNKATTPSDNGSRSTSPTPFDIFRGFRNRSRSE